MKSVYSAALIFFSFSALSQVQFQFDQSIQITQNGNLMGRAFEGGLNSAQFQTMDLNGDGNEDLIIFHRISRSITTYLNINDQWIFSPQYHNQFPVDVANWMILKDFDCDGKKDLFTSTALGIKVYQNQSTGGLLVWETAREFLTWDAGSNIQVAATDIPGIVDVNGDGALDILTYRFGSAGSIDYYQNTGTCGSLDFTRITRSWGNFFDCGCNDFSFGVPCSTGGSANFTDDPLEQEIILHAGGKTILPFDADNDGDIDIITSDELCENLIFLRNDGSPAVASMTSFEMYPSSQPVNYQFFPSAFLEDVDFDGIKDLIISTNIDNNAGNLVDFQNQIRFFQNTGSNEIPVFASSNAFLQDNMVDLGEDAYPTFFDYDQDGDFDLFVGHKGKQDNGNFIGSIWLFENTGNQFNPSFELIETDFAEITQLGYSHIKPQFGDLDNDGNIDLLVQAKVGPLDARVFVLSGNGQGQYSNPIDLGFDVDDDSNPMIYDLNEDGLSDVLIGQQFGSLTYHENQGRLTFTHEQNFGGFSDDFTKQNLSIAIGRFTENNRHQMITIDSQGQLTWYSDVADENFQKGDLNQNILLFNEELSSTSLGRANFLAAADLHGDGLASLVVGTSRGGLLFLRNIPEDGSTENALRVSISPNPSTNLIRVLANSDAQLDIIDINGKILESGINIQHSVVKELRFNQAANGMYLIRIRTNDGRMLTKRILIQP